MTDLLGGGGTTATTTPPAATPTTPTGPGTGGTFPQAQGNSPLDAYLPAASQILTHLTPGTFSSDYGVSSSQMPTFLGADGKLNSAAAEWVAYHLMSQPDRQNLQDILSTAGLMKPTDATGIPGTASNDAFRNLVGTAASQNVTADYLLGQVNQGGLGQVQQQIQGQVTNAQKALATAQTTPITAQVTNPTTLDAALTNAFDQTVGYAPSEAQKAAFRSIIQGQEVGLATSGRTAAEAQARTNLAQAQSEQTALKSLGPNGVDTFLKAYQAAVNGGGMPGAGTPQGPVTGSAPNAQYLTPGQPLPTGSTVGFSPGGQEFVGSTLPTQTTQQVPNTYGAGGALATDLNPLTLLHPSGPQIVTPGTASGGTHGVTTPMPTPGQATAPGLPAGLPGTTQLHGGIYALSPGMWQQAKTLYDKAFPGTALPATAGDASETEQTTAARLLAQSLYSKSNSWSDVAIQMAGGTPGKTTAGQKATGTKSNIQSFAEGVSAAVDNQIQQLQIQANQPGPPVTEKVSAPDVTAEANLQAKEQDPVGYYAANAATAGSLLNEMLAGAPQMYGQGTADTFTGPVDVGAATSSTAVA